jgi:hypothetical protein
LLGDFIAIVGGCLDHQVDISLGEVQLELANQLSQLFLANELGVVGINGSENILEVGVLNHIRNTLVTSSLKCDKNYLSSMTFLFSGTLLILFSKMVHPTSFLSSN